MKTLLLLTSLVFVLTGCFPTLALNPNGTRAEKGDTGSRGEKGDKGDKGDRGESATGIYSGDTLVASVISTDWEYVKVRTANGLYADVNLRTGELKDIAVSFDTLDCLEGGNVIVANLKAPLNYVFRSSLVVDGVPADRYFKVTSYDNSSVRAVSRLSGGECISGDNSMKSASLRVEEIENPGDLSDLAPLEIR